MLSCRVWRLYTKDYFIVWTRESSDIAPFLKVKALALGVQMWYIGDSSELHSIVDVIVYKLVACSSEAIRGC